MRRCSSWPHLVPKVLHLRCVEYARRYGIPIHVRSSFSSQLDGTLVTGSINDEDVREQMEAAIISGVAHDRSEAKITIVGVPDKIGEAARIFEAHGRSHEINIDMIVQNVSATDTGLTDISFTLPTQSEGQAAMERADRAAKTMSATRRSSVDAQDRQGLVGWRRHALQSWCISAKLLQAAWPKPGSISR
jgi:aspartokinase